MMSSRCCKASAASGLETRFWWGLFANGGLAMAELVTGILTGSSAILADAFMNVDDTAALLLSIYSERKTTQPPNEMHTFGYKRMDAFAGFVKGCLLLVTSFLAVTQAVKLLFIPETIVALPVIVVGSIAFVVNLVSALWLKEDACHSLNAKGTFSCMIYDAVGSAAVVISSLLSYAYPVVYFDVAAALLIAFFMAKTGWGIFQEGMGYFLQAAPAGFDYEDFERAVLAVEGVSSVGDMHVWSQNPTEHHITCKVGVSTQEACDCARIIARIEDLCDKQFGIRHVTIQPVYSSETLARFCRTST